MATVGLGIGATTVIFSAVNAALLRPLPYADPARLVRIYTDAPPNKFRFSVADYLALQAQQTQFEQIAGYTDRAMAFSDGNVAERLRGRVVSWTYFALLGIRPAIGRDFTRSGWPAGQPAGGHRQPRFWQQRLGGRPDVIGTLDPARRRGPRARRRASADVGPLEQRQEFFVAAQWDTPRRKGPFFITVLGRLRHESARSAAAGELRAINRRIFPLWQSSYQDEKASWSMMDLKAHVVGDVGTIAGLALAAVGLVWLIACANASNLLIARVTSRRRELAVRAALGASRGRVVRYLLAESALLAMGAAARGIRAGLGGRRTAARLRGDLLPAHAGNRARRAGAVAAGGVSRPPAPALRSRPGAARHAAARWTSRCARWGDRRPAAWPSGACDALLVGSQFAIATPLLVVAGLLLVSLNELRHVDLGFDTHNLLSGSIQLPAGAVCRSRGASPPSGTSSSDASRRCPGVSGVAFADGRPPDDVGNFNNFDLEASPTRAGTIAAGHAVGLGDAGVLPRARPHARGGTSPRRARRPAAPIVEVVVVDRAWAKRFFPNESAVGKRFREGGCTTCPWTTVVGVVSDVKYAGLDKPDEGPSTRRWPGEGRLRSRRRRTLPLSDAADGAPIPLTVLPAVRQIVRELDPSLPFSSVATIDDLVAQSLQRAAVAVPAGRRLRAGRARPLGRRHLRRDGVLRPAAREGHQHSPGARRQPGRCAAADRRPGHEGRRGRRRRRLAGRARADAPDVEPVCSASAPPMRSRSPPSALLLLPSRWSPASCRPDVRSAVQPATVLRNE